MLIIELFCPLHSLVISTLWWFPQLLKLISFLVHQLFGPPKLLWSPAHVRRVRRFWGPGAQRSWDFFYHARTYFWLVLERSANKKIVLRWWYSKPFFLLTSLRERQPFSLRNCFIFFFRQLGAANIVTLSSFRVLSMKVNFGQKICSVFNSWHLAKLSICGKIRLRVYCLIWIYLMRRGGRNRFPHSWY